MKKRIVVTGIGIVTPLGTDLETVWKRIVCGECGIKPVPSHLKLECTGYGSVDNGSNFNQYNSLQLFGRDVSKEYSKFIQYAMYCSDIAIHHAKLINTNSSSSSSSSSFTKPNLDIRDLNRAGVVIGSGGMGSIHDVVMSSKQLDISYRKLSPYFVPKVLGNMAAGHVSIRHGLKGPVHSVATACAAGSHAIGDAYNFIRLGYADIILAGGTESNIDELSIAGFARMKALSSNSNVAKSSRPFDRNRDGFVIGEGACIMVLEELSHALARNASIIAEIVGYGLSACAYHSTSPSPDGDGAYRSMSIALIDAGIKTEDVGYINAHATSTVLGDNIEVSAIDRLFHNISSRDMPLYVSSTKGATGHLLGAAGAVESAFACLALRDNVIPPTINLDNVDVIPKSFLHVPNYGIHYSNKMLFTSQESFTEYLDSEKNHQNEHVTKSLSETTELKHVLKNSFGFGGMNASLLFSKFKL